MSNGDESTQQEASAFPAAACGEDPERLTPDDDSDVLFLELDGFEGPLDLLLVLARNQKVDLAKISILHLAEQYLAYIDAARELRLEIAADYLVMASWLAYLKSKLLLPEQAQPEDGPTGQELAAQLAFRLKRLEAMREALASLMGRKRLGLDLFSRGLPEGIRIVRSTIYQASIFDLLKAYAEQLDKFLEEYKPSPVLGNTVTASSFGATLELAREGFIELRQNQHFGPLYVKWLNRAADEGAA